MTALELAEDSLRKSEALLTQALEAANAGVWESLPETGEFHASDRALALYGLPPGTRMTHEMLLAAAHPDDRARVESALGVTLNTGAPFRVEFRLLHQDGSPRWLSTLAEARKENRGIRLVGLVQDITERKRAEEALRASESRLSLALSAGKLATWDMLVPNGEMVWNEEHFRALGYSGGEVAPSYEAWAARIHPEDRPRVEEAFMRTLNEGGEYACEYRVLLPDQTIKWFEARGRVETDPEGHPRRSYGVLIDTTQRTRAEEALREADQRKDEFLATLAHELRNPLAPIYNATQVLQKKHGVGDPDAPMLGMIQRQTDHLVRLVDDLLEITRISRGKIELRKEQCDMIAVLREALEASRLLIDKKSHRLVMSLPAATLPVFGDPVRLTQIVANLINNAVKYTPAQGLIEIGLTSEGEEVVLRVSDNGVGIPADVLPTVFNLFTQADNRAGASEGGLGIGLALVKQLVELHDGCVEAHSPGHGRGSEFVVRLPICKNMASIRTASKRSTTGSVTPLRALVIDDDHDVGGSFGLLLESLGVAVKVVHDGVSGVAAIDQFDPDFVFVDIGMPGVDGYETARRIRKHARSSNIQLIALTGWGQEEDRRRTREAGFDLHLTKPTSIEAVEDLLRHG